MGWKDWAALAAVAVGGLIAWNVIARTVFGEKPAEMIHSGVVPSPASLEALLKGESPSPDLSGADMSTKFGPLTPDEMQAQLESGHNILDLVGGTTAAPTPQTSTIQTSGTGYPATVQEIMSPTEMQVAEAATTFTPTVASYIEQSEALGDLGAMTAIAQQSVEDSVAAIEGGYAVSPEVVQARQEQTEARLAEWQSAGLI